MKKLIYLLSASLILALGSCGQTPAENAQKQADKAAKEAEKHAEKAVDEATDAKIDAAYAIVNTIVANADELMAQVPMPELSSSDAKKYANKIGNHIVDYINAKDDSKADSYAQKVSDDLTKVDELTTKGKISPADALSIKEYGAELLLAVGLSLP